MIEFSAVHTKRPRDLGPRIWDLGTPDWDLRTPGWTSYGIPLRGDKGVFGPLALSGDPRMDPIWTPFGPYLGPRDPVIWRVSPTSCRI